MANYFLSIIFLQSQLSTERLDKAADSGDINQIFIWIITVVGGLLIIIITLLWKEYTKKTNLLETSKDDYAKKIEDLSRNYSNKIEELNNGFIKKIEDTRIETTKKSEGINTLLLSKVEEWNKQWAESEKYAMDVIKGLNKLIENGDIMTSNRHTQILDKLTTLEGNILSSIKTIKNRYNENQ